MILFISWLLLTAFVSMLNILYFTQPTSLLGNYSQSLDHDYDDGLSNRVTMILHQNNHSGGIRLMEAVQFHVENGTEVSGEQTCIWPQDHVSYTPHDVQGNTYHMVVLQPPTRSTLLSCEMKIPVCLPVLLAESLDDPPNIVVKRCPTVIYAAICLLASASYTFTLCTLHCEHVTPKVAGLP